MNNNSLFSRCLEIARTSDYNSNGRCQHFSFVAKRNTIIATGKNNYYGTHTLAKKLGYYDANVHSELDLITKCKNSVQFHDLKKLHLINIRINSKLEIRPCRPCSICEKWIAGCGFKSITYIDERHRVNKIKMNISTNKKSNIIKGYFKW